MQTIVKILGYGVIVGASIVKLPQIIKIVKKKSTFGLSFSGNLMEVILFRSRH
jgi:mannose-P-dolichol utilization defect 1